MRRVTLYSSSRSSMTGRASASHHPDPSENSAQAREGSSAEAARRSHRLSPRQFYLRHQRLFWAAAGGLFVLLLVFAHAAMTPATRELTQDDIRAAVLHSLQTDTLPSPMAKAYEVIRPSVVRVRGMGAGRRGGKDVERSVGTGVVIVDNGTILTSLHVVREAQRVKVVFADGLESDATIIGARPEHDLAVLQAQTIPDDLIPATMRSTEDLRLGDRVAAVGFPFGIGPSLTAGVVSGLRREFRSRQGKRVLTNLIQFDAAVNPGNSGGPLMNAQGEVLGIVTAILNPTEQGFFVGIGFAVPIENAAAAAGLPPF
jgi:S1-C subfamily serine protease